jgi:hypothetical protein
MTDDFITVVELTCVSYSVRQEFVLRINIGLGAFSHLSKLHFIFTQLVINTVFWRNQILLAIFAECPEQCSHTMCVSNVRLITILYFCLRLFIPLNFRPKLEYVSCTIHGTWSIPFYLILKVTAGTRWRSWLKHFATNRKVTGWIPEGIIGLFYSLKPSGCTIALGSTHRLTEMNTRGIFWKVNAAGA